MAVIAAIPAIPAIPAIGAMSCERVFALIEGDLSWAWVGGDGSDTCWVRSFVAGLIADGDEISVDKGTSGSEGLCDRICMS